MVRESTRQERWEIMSGARHDRLLADLVPDRSLRKCAETSGGWLSTGERPWFDLFSRGAPVRLTGGWYQLDGLLASSDAAEPCLRVLHAADGGWTECLVRLPSPTAEGEVHALVLVPMDTTSVAFSPGCGLSHFRLGGFKLRRISRAIALARMLGPLGLDREMLSRISRFLVDAAARGLSKAADALFLEYQRKTLPTPPADYAAWAARFDTLTAEHMDALHGRTSAHGDDMPLISILLPVYQTPERWLRRCIESVIAQVHPSWELCIVDDASPDGRVMEVLEEYSSKDIRIKVSRRETNGHISAASNTALELATGEYVALLDHDDELRPHALLEVADAIRRSPGAALLYSDEDKLDAAGRRFDPYFKPDWDPDLLLGQNYLCHLTTIRSDLVRDVGGFRPGFEGSQDHDLVLRCTERLQPHEVVHIPKVLYHWRAIAGSTALSRDAKDYASSAGARAVSEHLDRCHPGARVEELSHGHYRVHWPLPDAAPKVSLIVPTRDRVELLHVCVESVLERTRYPDFEVVVVDNQSSDPETLAYLLELKGRDRVRVLRHDAPFNYSRINNWAASQCDGEILGLLNNDIEVISPDWLSEMASQATRPGVGAVGAMLYYPNDTIQHAGVVLGIHGVAAHLYAGQPRGYPGYGGRARVAQTMSAVTGACLLVNREAFLRVGGLDESLAIAFNDIDFCLRLRAAGYRNVWTPFAELYHHESASRGLEDTDEKKQRFMQEVEFMRQRWGEQLLRDPAYNPNLSLASLNCELAMPPRNAPPVAG